METHLTKEQYDARNLEGFEGDHYLKEEVERLVLKHNVNLIIETGSFLGGTSRQFAAMAKNVITIEINEAYYNRAKILLAPYQNVNIINDDTLKVLPGLLYSKAVKGKSILWFADSHWLAVCPLLEELKLIALAELKPVIVIHDFYVPDRDYGYDSYGGQRFDINFIKDDIELIYGEAGYSYYYNREAEGAKRGVIFIEPM